VTPARRCTAMRHASLMVYAGLVMTGRVLNSVTGPQDIARVRFAEYVIENLIKPNILLAPPVVTAPPLAAPFRRLPEATLP